MELVDIALAVMIIFVLASYCHRDAANLRIQDTKMPDGEVFSRL